MRICAVALIFPLLLGPDASSLQDAQVSVGHMMTAEELLTSRHIDLTEPSLVSALRNPDPHVRYLAAAALADVKATDAIPAIIAALQSETVPETKVNIALALVEFGEQQGFVTLKNTCVDREVPAQVRVYATMDLLGFGDESCLDGLLDVLTSNSSGSGTRVLALGRLHQFRKVSEGDFQRIAAVTLNALADPEPDVRIAASHAVSQFPAGIATPSLEKAITAEKEEGVRSLMKLDLQQVQAHKDR